MIGVVLLFHSILAGNGDTIGGFFDHPPAYPGNPWLRDGHAVSENEILATAGPSHCQWDSITMLSIGWPLGTLATSGAQERQYIRDPHQLLPGHPLLGTWQHNPTLPPDAADTRHRYGTIKLFLAPSDQDRYAYVVAPKDSERWPRGDPMLLCS